MEPGTHNVYNDLYQNYSNSFRDNQQRDLAVRIRGIIDRVIDELDVHTLRADGKFLLLVNFHQMVASPMLSDISHRRIAEEELLTDIYRDISGILRICRAIPAEEISSHLVLRATDLYWEFSRTFVEQYW